MPTHEQHSPVRGRTLATHLSRYRPVPGGGVDMVMAG